MTGTATKTMETTIQNLLGIHFIIVGRRIKIFLRLKADGKIVLLVTSVASFAKVLYVNKS